MAHTHSVTRARYVWQDGVVLPAVAAAAAAAEAAEQDATNRIREMKKAAAAQRRGRTLDAGTDDY